MLLRKKFGLLKLGTLDLACDLKCDRFLFKKTKPEIVRFWRFEILLDYPYNPLADFKVLWLLGHYCWADAASLFGLDYQLFKAQELGIGRSS